MLKKLLLSFFLCAPLFADTGFNVPAVVVSTDDARAVSKGIQKIIFSTGTSLSISGSVAKVSGTAAVSSTTLPSGSTHYVQTNPTSKQTTAFNTSGGTVDTLNTNRIHFQGTTSMMTYPDNVSIFSLPDIQSMHMGYNGNLVNIGGVFNTSYGSGAMPYPYSGNFNNIFGNSGMSGNLLTGENNNGMGYGALANLSSGFFNNAMGGSAAQAITSGQGNTAVGSVCLSNVTSSNYNTAIGLRALFWTKGAVNTGIGYEAGAGTTTVSGENANVNGDHNVFLGPMTGQSVSSTTALTNSVAIGYGALVQASSQCQIGGQVGSGTELDVHVTTLTVAKVVTISSNTTIAGGFTSITPPARVIALSTETISRIFFDATASTISVGGLYANGVSGRSGFLMVSSAPARPTWTNVIGTSVAVVATNAAGKYEFTASTSTAAPFHINVSTTGHLNSQGIPGGSVTSCGTSPSFVGSDVAGTITVGAGVVTACTYNFAVPWTNAPSCVMSINLSGISGGITTLTTALLTFSYAATVGSGTIYFHCIGLD